jgi:hypothetical protein
MWPDVDLVFCVEAGEGDPEAEVAAPVEETGKHNISCFFTYFKIILILIYRYI